MLPYYIIVMLLYYIIIMSKTIRLKSLNGRDITKWALIDANSIVSGWNYDILT